VDHSAIPRSVISGQGDVGDCRQVDHVVSDRVVSMALAYWKDASDA
jgi:hypothetical protein